MTGDIEREFVIHNLLVRIHFIIVMIGRIGFAPQESESSFSGSRISTFLVAHCRARGLRTSAFDVVGSTPLASSSQVSEPLRK
jgi:hypothetical protein